jgi:hypothetical protein
MGQYREVFLYPDSRIPNSRWEAVPDELSQDSFLFRFGYYLKVEVLSP